MGAGSGWGGTTIVETPLPFKATGKGTAGAGPRLVDHLFEYARVRIKLQHERGVVVQHVHDVPGRVPVLRSHGELATTTSGFQAFALASALAYISPSVRLGSFNASV